MQWLSKPWIKKHSIVLIYVFTFFLSSIGIFANTGFRYLNYLLFFFGVFTITYVFLQWDKISGNRFINAISNITPLRNAVLLKTLLYGLLIFTIVFPFIHLAYLGYCPFLKAFFSTDYYEIAFIRQSIIEHDNSLIKYLGAFTLKGFMPFFLLFFYIYNRRIFYVVLIVSIGYAFGMMQKGFIFSILLPLAFYLILKRKYLPAALYICIILLGTQFLYITVNPDLRFWSIKSVESKPGIKEEHAQIKKLDLDHLCAASDGLIHRVFITTGKASSYWFAAVPSVYPYARGCGYHFLAPFMGCNYEDFNYARKIYDIVYVNEAKMGFKGTLTAASFMYDYANFGYFGLFYSAMILAVLFFFLIKIFGHDIYWLLSLNSMHILWLSSAALTTTLFSGGWAIMIFLYVMFKNILKESEAIQPASIQR